MSKPIPRALVLSGDKELSAHMKSNLIKLEYPEVTVMENGIEGLKQLATTTYDIIVCHNKLKFISGWNFVKEMKTSDKIPNMPVMLMGELPAPAPEDELNAYGLVKYLKSPPPSGEIGMVLNSTLQLFRTSGTIENKFTKAKAALLGAKTDVAVEIFSELHGLTKKNLRSSLGLAEAYTQSGQQDKAEAILLESAKANGSTPTAALMQIKIFIKKGMFPEAHMAALELLGPISDSPFYHVRVLNTYVENKSIEEAEHICRDAIGKEFKLPEFSLSMSRLLFAKGRFDECIAALEKATILYGATSEMMNIKGAALRKLNRLDDALMAYEMALKLSPMDSRVYFNMAVCCISKKAIKEARQHLEMCLKITPDFPNAQQKLEEVNKFLGSAA
ncbi:MAG: tetratricopeptide repeat protein [Proteobacteria bacterium]|nr:MAG: tetratricopeptide repeat protein [Pseudomonadota bacterium]